MNRSYRYETVLLLGSILFFSAMSVVPDAFAQVTSGTIFGTVKDPSGAMVSGATVTISDPANGLTRTVTTSASGEFAAPGLYPGNYTITIEAKGFKKLESSGFVLSAADKLSAGELTIEVGAATDSVSVTADAGQVQLQADSGERSDVITGKQINDIALNGRNVLDYMKLIPGVSGTSDTHVSGTGHLSDYNINGTRGNQHEFTIDGASNVDTGDNGGTHVTINLDAIEEVKVLTSNYQAEFGKAAGGQIALVTKGGTNQWHGDGRFFHRNDSLNANEYFNKQSELSNDQLNEPEIYRYNYFGYQVGGPIKKDKLFVFWSQEFYRQLIPLALAQFYTPTTLERQGNFSQSVDGNGQAIIIAGPGITNNIIDPTQLPAAQQAIFQQMEAMLNLFPLPNVPGFGSNGLSYNYSQSLSGEAPRREDILRVDYQVNSRNRLYGRWIHNSENDSSPFTPFPGPFGIFACSSGTTFKGGCTQQHPGWNFSANLVSTISPTVLNEFSIGPSHSLSLAAGVNGNISRGANGITFPLLFPVSQSQAIPDMSFGGLNNVNFQGPYLGATPWKQANTTINVNDNLSWVRHNHTFKTGVFYQRSRKDQIAWGNINGQFSFNDGPTSGGTCAVTNPATTCQLGDPLASALEGAFSSFDQSTARPTGYFRYNQLEFYVQDTWKVTQRFTLDYGMRFAWIPPQYDAANQVALFNPSAYIPADAVTIDYNSGAIINADGGNPLNGMQYVKNHQLPAGGWGSRGIMPEPRLGFAYDLLDTHKTILRGGIGMMHDRVQGNLIFNTVFNNPAVVQTPSVAANNIVNLPGLSTSSAESPVQGDGNILGAAANGKVPTVYSFSLGVQQEIAHGTTLDIAYVGSMSRHLVSSRNINAVPYGASFLAANQDPNCSYSSPGFSFNFGGTVPAVQPGLEPQYSAAGYDFNGWCAYGHSSYTNAYLVPFKGYGQIPYLRWDGTSNYNSLQVSLQRRFGKRLTFGGVYTWSKSMVTASSDQDEQNPVNSLLDYRAASWDRPHVFAANYVYELPGLAQHLGEAKWLSYITDHYQLSGVTQAMSGTPVDLNNNYSFPSGSLDGGNMWGNIPFYYTADRFGNPSLPAVGLPARGTRDTIRYGGIQNWDMSLMKSIPLGKNEARYLEMRLEAFNAFNHPNFTNQNYVGGYNVNGPWEYSAPNTPLSISKNSNFGTNAATPNTGPGGFRVVQLGAKFYF
ncbi:MAG: carboxypeptidase regulatory-like domain-containing protein [Terriglobales bacterium]